MHLLAKISCKWCMSGMFCNAGRTAPTVGWLQLPLKLVFGSFQLKFQLALVGDIEGADKHSRSLKARDMVAHGPHVKLGPPLQAS